jgi:Domain of unknown function (DUF4384)
LRLEHVFYFHRGEDAMKSQILLVAGAMLALALLPVGTFAQDGEQSAKNLYLVHARNAKRGQPGVKIAIELKRDGVTRKVPLTYSFREGDKVRFHFETNFNAYVKIINGGSSGALQLLYPYQGAPELVVKRKVYSVPRGDLWFEFDRNPGVERLVLIFSSQPLEAETQSGPSGPGEGTPGPPGGSGLKQGLAGLNRSALENGKDFALVQDSENTAYGVAPGALLRKPIGIRIDLRHK